MKKLLQGAVLPFIIFTSGVLLLGCNQANEYSRQQTDSQSESAQNDDQQKDQDDAQDNEQNNDENQDSASNQDDNRETQHQGKSDLKQGNMFYIARDVADVQLKTGDYVEKLQQTQTDLQQAIESKDQTQLQHTVKNLSRELQGFNTALISLDLKTQEIDHIRQQVLKANKQVLNSSLLNGDLDISKVDFKKIEKQMNMIQTDMVKLAGMVLLSAGSDQPSNQSNDRS